MGYIVTALLVSVVIASLPALRRWYWSELSKRKNGCNNPPKLHSLDPVFGTDTKIATMKEDGAANVLYYEEAMHHKYGRTWRETSLFGSTIHTAAEDNIQAVLKSTDWGIQSYRFDGMQAFCGSGVLSTDGTAWQRSRTLFQPSFHKNNIDLSYFEYCFRLFLDDLPTDGSTIDLQLALLPIFVDTTTKFILGHPLGLLDKSQPRDTPVSGEQFLHHFNMSTRGVGVSIFLGRLRHLLPKSFTTDHYAAVHKFVDFHIDREEQSTGPDRLASRSILHSVQKEASSKTEVRNQILHGFLGAMDTVAVLLSNAVRLLSRNPALYERLREEVKDNGPEDLTVEAVKKYTFLQKVIKETLRMHGVFPILARDAVRDTILPSGGGPNLTDPVFCPAGTRIHVNFWMLHRNESVFGPHANEFHPDRWDRINPSSWQFLPFGGGPRSCLGQYKASAEAACALVRLAQKFERIDARDDSNYQGELRLVARNVNGCKVGLIPA